MQQSGVEFFKGGMIMIIVVFDTFPAFLYPLAEMIKGGLRRSEIREYFEVVTINDPGKLIAFCKENAHRITICYIGLNIDTSRIIGDKGGLSLVRQIVNIHPGILNFLTVEEAIWNGKLCKKCGADGYTFKRAEEFTLFEDLRLLFKFCRKIVDNIQE